MADASSLFGCRIFELDFMAWDNEGSCFHSFVWKKWNFFSSLSLWWFGLCLVVSTKTFHFFHFVFITRVNCVVRHDTNNFTCKWDGTCIRPAQCRRLPFSAFVRSHLFPSTWICIFCSRLSLWCTRRRWVSFVRCHIVILGRCGLSDVSSWNPVKIPSSHFDSAPMTPTTAFSSFQHSFPVDAQRECARSCNCVAHVHYTNLYHCGSALLRCEAKAGGCSFWCIVSLRAPNTNWTANKRWRGTQKMCLVSVGTRRHWIPRLQIETKFKTSAKTKTKENIIVWLRRRRDIYDPFSFFTA